MNLSEVIKNTTAAGYNYNYMCMHFALWDARNVLYRNWDGQNMDAWFSLLNIYSMLQCVYNNNQSLFVLILAKEKKNYNFNENIN